MGDAPRASALPDRLILRRLEDEDSIADITDMLHRAYAALRDMGFKYWATHQPEEDTRKRLAKGPSWVGVLDGRVVATVTLVDPSASGGSPWYERPDVTKFEQFGVEPELQGRGIGSAILDLLEAEAMRLGVCELALDTAEGSTHLIRYYEARGYRFVEYADWRPYTNYRSVVLSKRL